MKTDLVTTLVCGLLAGSLLTRAFGMPKTPTPEAPPVPKPVATAPDWRDGYVGKIITLGSGRGTVTSYSYDGRDARVTLTDGKQCTVSWMVVVNQHRVPPAVERATP